MGSGNSKTQVEPTEQGETGSQVKDAGVRPPIFDQHRKCTNCMCIPIFVAYWLGLFIVAIIAFRNGDGSRLIFAQDYLGNTCYPGRSDCGNRTCGSNVFYPRAGMDAMLQGFITEQAVAHVLGDATSQVSDVATDATGQLSSETALYGICVEECPIPGDFICTYELEEELRSKYHMYSEKLSEIQALHTCKESMQRLSMGILNGFGLGALDETCKRYMTGCWRVAQQYESMFFRCLPNKLNDTTAETSCSFPVTQTDGLAAMPVLLCPDELELPADGTLQECDPRECFGRTKKACVPNPKCGQINTAQTTNFVYSTEGTESFASDVLNSVVGSWSTVMAQWLGDLQRSWYTIVCVSVGVAPVLGMLWLKILGYVVSFFIWGMCFVSLLSLGSLTVFSLGKGGTIDIDEAATWLVDQVQSTYLELSGGNTTTVSLNDEASLADVQSQLSSVLGTASTEVERSWWNALGVTGGCVWAVLAIILLLFRRRIKIAIAIYREASYIVRSLPSMITLPVLSTAGMLVCTVYFGVVFAYLYTAGNLETVNIDASSFSDTVSSLLNEPSTRRMLLPVRSELSGYPSFPQRDGILTRPKDQKFSVRDGSTKGNKRTAGDNSEFPASWLPSAASDIERPSDWHLSRLEKPNYETLKFERYPGVAASQAKGNLNYAGIGALGRSNIDGNEFSSGERLLFSSSDQFAMINESLSLLGKQMQTLAPLQLSQGLIMYHLFGFIWVIQVISGISYLTIAGSVCMKYWKRETESGFTFPLWVSFQRAVAKQIGSVIFASLVLTFVQIIRGALIYLDRQTRKLQQENMIIRLILKLVQCCIGCFGEVVKVITESAYIMMAMYGESFWEASKLAGKYLIENAARVYLVHFMGNFVCLMSKCVIVACAVGIEYLWLSTDERFITGGVDALNSPAMPLIVTGCASYLVASAFMYVYSVTVESLLLCFCVDAKINKESKVYFMPRTLRKFFADAKKKKRRMKLNKEKVHAHKTSTTVQPEALS